MTPNKGQLAVMDHPVGSLLVVAPPGCGKTEALALRLAGLVQNGVVKAPRKALGITFSNRAKSNLAARVRGLLGHTWRESVTVTNFHGLTARVIAAHGSRIGIPSDAKFPTRAWLRKAETRAGITQRNRDTMSEVLRQAKSNGVSDTIVDARLASQGSKECIEFERLRREEGRLDYHDLIRYGLQLLRDPSVGRLYFEHFGAIVVDEVQDLTPDQLELVLSLGPERTTFAGDHAQAIYRFAGADAESTFQTLIAIPSLVQIALDVSYRSSPAVLDAANALAPLVGGQVLRCADPSRWESGGTTALLSSADWGAEAATIFARVEELIAETPTVTIGLISRRSSRLARIRAAFRAAPFPVQDWGSANDVPEVAQLLHRCFAKLGARDQPEGERLEELTRRCVAAAERLDVETCDRLDEALFELRERVEDGEPLATAIRSSRRSQDPDEPVPPGVHLLNGHLGKGQEFDWVFVVGMEEGHIPDFRATAPEELEEELRVLLVMASRARHGLVVTYSSTGETRSGPRPQRPSRWITTLRPTLQHQW